MKKGSPHWEAGRSWPTHRISPRLAVPRSPAPATLGLTPTPAATSIDVSRVLACPADSEVLPIAGP
jgi:hypothetical protein